MKRSDDDPEIIYLHPRPEQGKRTRRWVWALGALFALFLLFQNAIPLYTDLLWFREVGYFCVFARVVWGKTALFFGFGLLFFALLYGNAALTYRYAPERPFGFLTIMFGEELGGRIRRALRWLVLGLCLFLSLWAGRLAAGQWASAMEFWNGVPFGVTDPIFSHDVSFYVFRLPFLEYCVYFVRIALVLALALTATLIAFMEEPMPGETSWQPMRRGVNEAARRHLLALTALLALTQACATRFHAYDLLLRKNGVFTGAGYTDVTWRLFGNYIILLLLVLTAALCGISLLRPRLLRWAVAGAGSWLVAVIVLGGVAPALVQSVVVVPNQFALEKQYIQRNIAFTRKGFGLENVRRVENFPADESLNAAQLKANRGTLENVRLWDYGYLARVYAQIHTVKTYYKFEQNVLGSPPTHNIDIDRYRINGQLRQVMLGAREIDVAALPSDAQTWQNRRLSYTHGYGLVMSPVNRVLGGQPDYFIQGFPPNVLSEAKAGNAATLNLQVTRPEIYFGLLAQDFVIVDTQQPEFDYPATDGDGTTGNQDHYTTYQGRGGVRIGDSTLAKLAFSLRLGDGQMLLAKNFKPSTRILFRRDIRERVMTLAPFVQQDSDPYLIVTKEGRLVWMLDCYTLSDRFPYSTPQPILVGPRSFIAPNYMRNSIKATVDAYDGTVRLYISDANDPIARTYSRIFPGLLQPMAQMPADLREHIRYPEDLFRVQRSVYATYHVDDPRVFYLKEDAWGIPTEPNMELNAENRSGAQRQMEPYYVVMRLSPGENEEFLLMSPLSPINREDKNILGWMCARCDGDKYGELVLYRFTQKSSVNGPSQVVSLINSDRDISPQLTLLRQSGSKADFGNLIVIPIEKSLLYIAPLYIESTQSARLPQLQKVVVVFGQRAIMADTLEGALMRLFPGYGSEDNTTPPSVAPNARTPSPPAQPVTVPAPLKALIDRAAAQYDSAQQKIRSGDFAAYGTAIKEMERTLKELQRLSAGR